MNVCFVQSHKLLVAPASSKAVRLADYSKLSRVISMIKHTITLHNPIINNILFILKSSISDLMIETDFEEHFKTFCFRFGDDRPALHLNAEPHEIAVSLASNDHKRCYYPAIFKFSREDCNQSHQSKDFI